MRHDFWDIAIPITIMILALAVLGLVIEAGLGVLH